MSQHYSDLRMIPNTNVRQEGKVSYLKTELTQDTATVFIGPLPSSAGLHVSPINPAVFQFQGFLSSVCLQNMDVVDETLNYRLDDVTLGNLDKGQAEKPRL